MSKQTLKKIPKVVLSHCEWGRDDYSLNVENLALTKPEEPSPPAPSITSPSCRIWCC